MKTTTVLVAVSGETAEDGIFFDDNADYLDFWLPSVNRKDRRITWDVEAGAFYGTFCNDGEPEHSLSGETIAALVKKYGLQERVRAYLATRKQE